MSFILLFLLAHFVGDFVFQTNKIAKIKSEHSNGVLVHCIIVGIIQIFFMSIYGLIGILAASISSFLHYYIDFYKYKLGKIINKYTFVYFIFDQGVHIVIILLLAYFLNPTIVFNINIDYYVVYLLFIIFFTYISTVMCKMILRDIFEEIRNMNFFLKKEREIDLVFSLSLFIIFVYFNEYYSIGLSGLLFIIYFHLEKKFLSYSTKITILKYVFFLLLAYLGSNMFFSLLM